VHTGGVVRFLVVTGGLTAIAGGLACALSRVPNVARPPRSKWGKKGYDAQQIEFEWYRRIGPWIFAAGLIILAGAALVALVQSVI
jgi:hypothetical protein